MSQAHQLYQLQQVDTEIREKKQRLGEVMKAQRETQALLAAREKASQATAVQEEWLGRQKSLNLELQRLDNEAKRVEQRLYSGTVKNPKELTDMEQKIAALKRRRGAFEDEMLEAMIMLEEAEAEKTAADEDLVQITAVWEQDQIDLKKEQNQLALRLRDLLSEREKMAGQVSANLLTEYDTLLKRKHGVAVARLKQGICQGCRLNVSESVLKSVGKGLLTHCNACGRILTDGS